LLRKKREERKKQKQQDVKDTDAFRKQQQDILDGYIAESYKAYQTDKDNFERAQREKEAAFQDFVSTIQNLASSFVQLQLAQTRAETNFQIQSLKTRLDQRLISEEDYNARVLQLQRQQFEREKSLNRAQALINGAVAATQILSRWSANPVVAGLLLGLTAASVAAQIATINAQTPGFKEGGYTGNVGVNEIAGVTHGQEYVIPAAPTKKNMGLLEAIHKGKEQDYIAKTYVEPALRSMKGSTAERMAGSMGLNFDDTNLLYAIRSNKTVRLSDDSVTKLASALSQSSANKVISRRSLR
jgi:hypothetical protein